MLNPFCFPIEGGYLVINVKDFEEFKLCADTRRIVEEMGFTYVDSVSLKNITRPSAKVDLNTDEVMMVFQKISNQRKVFEAAAKQLEEQLNSKEFQEVLNEVLKESE